MAARDLPARPNLEQYRKQAKELLKAWKASGPQTTRKLADAQHAIAREHGFDSWKKFIEEIARRTGQAEKAAIWKAAEDAFVAGDVSALDRLLRQHQKMFSTERPQSSWSGGLAVEYAEGDARASIVRGHFFESWDQFADFDKLRKDPTSPVSRFGPGDVAHDDCGIADACGRPRSLYGHGCLKTVSVNFTELPSATTAQTPLAAAAGMAWLDQCWRARITKNSYP